MGANHHDVAQRWVDVIQGKKDRLLKGSNVFADRDTIYSYGYHFPMGIALRDKKGQPSLFLLNGDRYSVTTSRHQSDLRSAVARSEVPHVIIPFAALSAAGIQQASIELVASEDARYETINHTARVRPEGSVWVTEPVSGYVRKSDEDIALLLKQRSEAWGREVTEDSLQPYDVQTWQQTGEQTRLFSQKRGGHVINVTEDEQGTLYSWQTSRHWLGESLIRATVETVHRIKCRVCKGSGRATEGWSDPNAGGGLSFHCQPCGGRGGRTAWSQRTSLFLSGFDRNEPRPSYFFCELPKGAKATTVDEALEALKPETVKVAEAHGRTVIRQGDIFAVSLPTLDNKTLRQQGAKFARSAGLLGTNHIATEVAVLPNGTTLARGFLRHDPVGRRPDHRRVKLSDGWNAIVKNTVPVTKK